MSIGINRQRFTETMREQAAIGRTEDGRLDRLTLTSLLPERRVRPDDE